MMQPRILKQTGGPDEQRQLLLWPGIIIVVLQWLVRFGLPALFPGSGGFGVLGGLAGGLAVFIWWAFFSRAARFERWGAVALMIVLLIATSRLVHESVLTGMQGMMYFVYTVPVMSLAFVIWAVASRNLSNLLRRVLMVISLLLACGVWTLLRSEGITGEGSAKFVWRWKETSEDRFLSRYGDESPAVRPSMEAKDRKAEWPGFRGPNRDAHVHGLRIKTDWHASPPVELWRRPVGPGCSSFAVRGDLFYTQEQRGDEEVIACYSMASGGLVWSHGDSARFWDSHAGAGPRSTPTLKGSRVYTLGATGILNVLDADSGRLIWSRNAALDTGVDIPGWGFTSSPLVIEDVVIVALAGTMIAYDVKTGDRQWLGPDGGKGYSSPHLLNIEGVQQVLLMSEAGATSVIPEDGSVLWEYSCPRERIIQPALTQDGDLLISAEGKGLRRISVDKEPAGWKIEERWKTYQLKPNFNDLVVHEGYVFGFDGPLLVCIDVMDGKRCWKGGRYSGQLLLLDNQDLLLVVSEKGELVLINASPDKYTELARFPAITGKTWNHPVLTGDILLVRNAREMAAFRLSPEKS
jgi:outer membrane protein assembly factor BamB